MASTGFWQQPRWFRTLFMTDVWERFSFFGMMAILFLFATAPPAEGGLGMAPGSAGALVGAYVSLTFIASIPGGWLGDRVLGQQRAVLHGAIMIAGGHCVLAVPLASTFYAGVLLVALGTGLLKPNLSALLGSFYPPERSAERESGFAIFFMSIQVSAMIAPFVTGTLGEGVNWHLGFGAAAAGMGIGIACYVRGRDGFGDTGAAPSRPLPPGRAARTAVVAACCTAAGALPLGAAVLAGLPVAEALVILLGVLTLVLPVVVFRRLRADAAGEPGRTRLLAYRWVFACTVMLFLLLGQGHSVLNQFALRHTDRALGDLTVPASWFQALHALFILIAAPVVARLWTGAGKGWSAPAKLAGGLTIGASGYLLMTGAAFAAADGPVSPLWLAGVHLLQAIAELTVGTVALGLTTQLAPPGRVGTMMGLWWLAGALGAALGGQAARAGLAPGGEVRPGYFLALAAVGLVFALIVHGRRAALAARLRPEPVPTLEVS